MKSVDGSWWARLVRAWLRVGALLAQSPQHELEVFLEGVDLTHGFSGEQQSV